VDACAALLQLLDGAPVVVSYIQEVPGTFCSAVTCTTPPCVSWSPNLLHHGRARHFSLVQHRLFFGGARDFATVPAIAPFVRDVMWSFNDNRPDPWTDSNVGALSLARCLRNVHKVTLNQFGSCPFTATAPCGFVSDVLASASVRELHSCPLLGLLGG
jgi:hypothetical protein